MNEIQVGLFISGFTLGWMLHSKKTDIIWWLRENWVPIFIISIFIIWPFSSLVFFWLNVYLWQNYLLTTGTMISIVCYLVVFAIFWWQMRKIEKGKDEG